MKSFLDIYLGILVGLIFLSLFGLMIYKAYLEGQLLIMIAFFVFILLPIIIWLAYEHGDK